MDALSNFLMERLLATSVQTAVLATAVWMLCRLVPRLSPSSQCWLWWLVSLQAVLGLFISPVEFRVLPYAQAVLPDTFLGMQWDAVLPDAPILRSSPVPATGEVWLTWQFAAFLLWSAGFLIMTWFTLRDWRRGNALVHDSAICDDEALLQALTSAARTCGTRRLPDLRLSANIESPVLIGHWRPVLLLPASMSMSNDELDMALAHELTHLRRGDLWWGVIPALARHLFFFHPLALLAIREYGIAREAACDAGVMDSGQRSRQDYGRLLVRLGATPASRTGLAVNSPTFQSLQRRLSLLQTTSFLSGTLSSALLVVVAATGVVPVRLVAGAAPSVTSSTGTSAKVPGTFSQSGEPGSIARAESPANEFFRLQLAEAQKRLQEHEALFAEFKKRNIGVVPDEGVQLEHKLEELARQYEILKRKYEGVQRETLELSRPIDTAEAERRLAAMLLVYKDAHPEVIRLRAQLKELQAKDSTRIPAEKEAYKIALGDSLLISVWEHPELGTELPVRPDGRISTPLVEDVIAVGRTPSQLARDIETRLAHYLRSPKVVVIMKTIAGHSSPAGLEIPVQ